MSGKTISKGTLGLRFMQNAQRAKQLKEVEEDRAQVKDDGQWEVDTAVRDAWGTVSSSSSSSQTISYESSYLPFLFPSVSEPTAEPSLTKPKGRRVFNKHGQEEVPQEKVDPEPTMTSEDPKVASSSKGSKAHPRPISISRASGGSNLFGFPPQQPKSANPNAQTAKQAIFDNTGVGVDLRASASKFPQSEGSVKPSPGPNVFLKPAGVDDPSETKSSSAVSTPGVVAADSDVIPGARSKKVKRVRSGIDQTDADAMKRKKKKKSAS
ncbi:hypothetical protein Hypma_001044 [Hypsizygus marmoreus]|uniref:Uncharacterized protein n=1 Tax=Hypsizygus marmoreus TaxID=39966 RepID=A0A369JAE6_HYPMA|nr:hypothetical protein Hypma_001044 [Hypsizygus marmoreus]